MATPNDSEPTHPGRSERDLEVLARVGRTLLAGVDLDQQLGLTLRLASEAVGANRASVMLLDPDTNHLEIRCSVGLPPEAILTTIDFGEGIAGWVAEHNQPFILHGEVSDPRFAGVDPTIESSLCLPLAVDGRVLGVLNLTRRAHALGRFTPEDLRLASSLADLASIALEKASLYAQLGEREEREERLARLLETAMNAQEIERRRIADEMHDGFLQALTRLFLQTEIARINLSRTSSREAVEAVESIQEAVRRTSEELRDFVLRVCPSSVDEMGLVPTLEAMVDEVCSNASLEGHFDNRAGWERLPAAVETILYRVAQEALRNVVKHADARQLWVSLERAGGEARLHVRDDGRSIEPEGLREQRPGASGLSAVKERLALAGGSIRVDSDPAGGTRLSARIPLDSFRR